MKEQIYKIVGDIEKMNPNDDYGIGEKLDEITILLSKSLNETIDCLNKLDENSISWISSRFAKIAYEFQSERFINCLKQLIIKFPGISYLQQDLNDAIDAMN